MQTCKYIFSAIILFICITSSIAQLADQSGVDSLFNDKDLIFNSEIDGFSQAETDKKAETPFKINSFVGTNFSYSKMFGYGQGINFGADGSYALSPRFSLSAGTVIGFSKFSHVPAGLSSEFSSASSGFNTTSITLYARGNYFITPRFTFTGIAFKEFSPYRNQQTINPMFMNGNREGMSLQFDYKLFDNFHFGAQFNYIRDDNPFGNHRSTIDNYYW